MYVYLMVRLFVFRFFLIHTATQMENIAQLKSMPALMDTTAITKLVSDKPSGKRDDEDVDNDTKVI